MELNEITEQIIGRAYQVANTLGVGFLEKVYENALVYELRNTGMVVTQQWPIKVWYHEVVVGEYCADLFVNETVIVELKAAKALDDIHMAQCLNYLRATRVKTCLLINFGTPKIGVKRISL
mgnify:CR=1